MSLWRGELRAWMRRGKPLDRPDGPRYRLGFIRFPRQRRAHEGPHGDLFMKHISLRQAVRSLRQAVRIVPGLLLAVASLVVALPATAQVFSSRGEPNPYSDQEVLTLAELRVLLLAREVPVETIDRVLAAFPEDRVFTQDEASLLIESILAAVSVEPPAEGRDVRETVRPGREDPAAPRREGDERTPIAPIRPEADLPLFGQSTFRSAPEEFDPAENVAVGPEYQLGAGDGLSIVLWGPVQRSWTPTIERDGTVALGPIGIVPAAGLTLGEFRDLLRVRLGEAYAGFEFNVTVRTLGSVQVSVLGEVRRPGTYRLSPFSTSFNALYYAGGPLETGSLRAVKVFRADSLLAEEDLYKLLVEGETKGDQRLATGYRIFVPPVLGLVTVRGAVRRPARYEIRPGETAGDAIRFAGGLNAVAYPTRAVLDRVGEGSGRETIELDLDEARSVELRDGDVLTVYSVYHVDPRRYVYIDGEVQSPGRYELFPGMTVSDLIYRAGNLLASAYLLRGELTRLEGTETDSVATPIRIDLETLLLAPDGPADPRLRPDDRVYVRRHPGWEPQATVQILGEVRFPGTYTLLTRRERLSSLIERAGGFTPEAFVAASALFRTGSGRIIADLGRAVDNPRGVEDVALADGDSLYVPRYNRTIQVVGEVSRPGALVYQPGKTAEYYLGRTGGLTQNADRGRIQIIRVDGVVEGGRRTFWFDPEVPPGAVIDVPAKPRREDVDWLGAFRDVATIVSGVATTIFIITQID